MQGSSIDIPRILIGALRGGSGKTIVSVGLIAALSKQGKTVAPFKKGPDYIDAGWLALSAGRPCFNLDTFMVDEETVCRSFLYHTSKEKVDIAVIEGNRGLYDGLDLDGTTSSASLAKLLNIPVILCLDCTKSTRSMAAVVLGFLKFDSEVSIKGVIVNQVAGSRHENLLRNSIEKYCGIPVIGSIPKLSSQYFPERHMGLIPTPEHTWAIESVKAAADMVKQHVGIPEILDIANVSANLPITCETQIQKTASGISHDIPEGHDSLEDRPKVGIVRDSAFQFYYPDNLEALETAGSDLVYISPLAEIALPDIDALYIGGGFPETHAGQLADNLEFKNAIKVAAEKGLPIYAECGGLMYLGESLLLDQSYLMTGVLPIAFGFSKKPQGHGYTVAMVDKKNPYFKTGTVIHGHEFHYSKVLEWKGDDGDMTLHMTKGRGILNKRDGICYKNVFATYTHIHALGVKEWASTLVKKAKEFAAMK